MTARSLIRFIFATLAGGLLGMLCVVLARLIGPQAEPHSTIAASLGWVPPVAAGVVIGVAVLLLGAGRSSSHSAGPDLGTRSCPECGRVVGQEWRLCPHCGSRLDDQSEP